jgi:hypothetical protein
MLITIMYLFEVTFNKFLNCLMNDRFLSVNLMAICLLCFVSLPFWILMLKVCRVEEIVIFLYSAVKI